MKKRNTIAKLATALVAAALVLVGMTVMPKPAEAADTVTVHFDVQYMQTDARSMLADINEFRTGDDAWYWNSDDTTKTTLTNLSELTYDYDLEKLAMQRAAEIAYSYAHTRPDNTTYSTITTEYSYSWTRYGENIAAGYNSYTTAADVLDGWKEKKATYSGQGHRRNLLSSNYNRIGIAGVKIGNTYYWVQEFAYATSSNTETKANDITTNVSVRAALSDLTVTMTSTTKSISLDEGASAALPTVTVKCKDAAYYPSNLIDGITPTDTPTWSVADTTVASISGSTLAAGSAGTTTLTAALYGTSLDIPVNVTAHVHSYTSTVTKAATCGTAGVRTYTCSCGDSYTETIAATGNHTWNSGAVTKAATCAATGVKTYTCTVCGTTKTESIAKTTNHSWTYESTTRDNCESAGTATYKCSVCDTTKTETVAAGSHTWNSGEVTKAATCAATGVKTYTCTVCGATKTETIAKTTVHTWNSGEVTTAATCKEAGIKTYTCTVCGTTKTETIAKSTEHTWTYLSTKRDNCEAEGTATYICSVCGTTKTETVAGGEHTWNEGTVTTAPTCGTKGVKTYTCSICGKTYTESVSATGEHTWTCTDSGRLNCEEAGTASYKCTVCGATKTENVAAGEHTWNAGEVTTEATYDNAGVKIYTCTECGTTKTESIPALTRKNLADADVVFTDGASFAYDYGDEIEPAIVVWYDGVQLTEGMDYEVAYADNTEPGTATVTVTGINGCKGTQTAEFEITKLSRDELLDFDWLDDEIVTGHIYELNRPDGLAWEDMEIISGDTDILEMMDDGEFETVGAGDTYIEVIVAEDDYYESIDLYISVTVEKDTEDELLDGPTGIKVKNTADGVELTWDPVDYYDTVYYLIYRSTSDDEYWTDDDRYAVAFEEDNCDVIDVDAEPGTAYCYAIYAFNGDGEQISYFSDSVVITYLAPITASDLTLANTAKGVSIKWTAVAGADGYIVYRKTSGGSYKSIKKITSGSTVAYTDTDALTAGTDYNYCVKAYANTEVAGITATSYGTYGGKTLRYLPSPNQTLTNTSTGITLKWTKIAGASGYWIYRKYGSSSSIVKYITSGSTVTWTDTTIASKNGYAYSYAVKPYYGSNYKSPTYKGAYVWTSIYRLTTPAIKTLKNAATKSMTATWAKNSTVTGYQFQYALNKTFTSGKKTVNVAGASKVSYKFASLTKGKTYYVRMRVYKKNSAGTVFYSAWSSVKYVKIAK